MSDNHGKDEIKRLRDEIDQLQSEPAYEKRWQEWYRDVLNTLSNLYGVGSTEFRGFERIPFKIERQRATARDRFRELLPVDEIPLDRYYLERLSEAREYLLSLILPNR